MIVSTRVKDGALPRSRTFVMAIRLPCRSKDGAANTTRHYRAVLRVLHERALKLRAEKSRVCLVVRAMHFVSTWTCSHHSKCVLRISWRANFQLMSRFVTSLRWNRPISLMWLIEVHYFCFMSLLLGVFFQGRASFVCRRGSHIQAGFRRTARACKFFQSQDPCAVCMAPKALG